jgi:hypothetical protein
MKLRIFNMKLRIGLLVLTLSIASHFAHAKKFPLTAAAVVPSAQGEVETGRDDNGNTTVQLKVEHLAQPENLTPPRAAYVVWFQERGGSNPTIQGQLRPDKKLKAKFRTMTPMKSFDVIVTAESDANAPSPGGTEILRASVQP